MANTRVFSADKTTAKRPRCLSTVLIRNHYKMEMRSSGRITHDVLRLACAWDLMTAGARYRLPWQVASAVCANNGKLTWQVASAVCVE